MLGGAEFNCIAALQATKGRLEARTWSTVEAAAGMCFMRIGLMGLQLWNDIVTTCPNLQSRQRSQAYLCPSDVCSCYLGRLGSAGSSSRTLSGA